MTANKYNTNYIEDDEDQERGNNAFDFTRFIRLSDFKNTSSTLFVNSNSFYDKNNKMPISFLAFLYIHN